MNPSTAAKKLTPLPVGRGRVRGKKIQKAKFKIAIKNSKHETQKR
jgi:hypothetical protein